MMTGGMVSQYLHRTITGNDADSPAIQRHPGLLIDGIRYVNTPKQVTLGQGESRYR